MPGPFQAKIRLKFKNIMDTPLSLPAFKDFLREVNTFHERCSESDSTWGEVVAEFYSLKTALDRITNNFSGGYLYLESVLKFNKSCFITVEQYNTYLNERVIPPFLRITVHDRIPVAQYVKFKPDLQISKQYYREQPVKKFSLKWRFLTQKYLLNSYGLV